LFPRESVKWTGKIHEKPLCDLPPETLKGNIKHLTYRDWGQYFAKFNQYTSIWAQNAFNNGKNSGVFNAFSRGAAGFFQMYILRKGFLDGRLGLVLCLNHFFYAFTKYIKLRQLRLSQKDL
jgi:hypothetical protein